EYSAEEFRQALENRINALSDQYGRTVSGVKVNIAGSSNKYFTFTSGTAGDNSFVKVTANSIWGLSNVPSARGSTSTWQIPQQARNDAGFPLYVDRNGLETSNPGDFSEAETKDLWAPVYLDNGELTFDSSGKIFSPNEAIQFKSATIGDSGATLKFSISYGASTQYSSPFSVRKQDQNGRPEGDLIGVEIGDDGLVSASYSNGTQKSLAKIVLANFATPTGLRQIGGLLDSLLHRLKCVVASRHGRFERSHGRLGASRCVFGHVVHQLVEGALSRPTVRAFPRAFSPRLCQRTSSGWKVEPSWPPAVHWMWPSMAARCWP
ncbi:MAG: flagellar hook-basal body complex protein, partial [Betaproteobacteria bacterium]|nr:flagellar hook-basal body complex protein [Betaproteobacteria bacterium]